MRTAAVILATLALTLLAPPADAARLCYWHERHDKGCRNQAVYLSKKPAPVPVVIEVNYDKGEPCDVGTDRCNEGDA